MPLRHWPTDCVLVTCPLPGEVEPAGMLDPQSKTCRSCGAAVLCCSVSLENAIHFAASVRRPVSFLCVPCRRGLVATGDPQHAARSN